MELYLQLSIKQPSTFIIFWSLQDCFKPGCGIQIRSKCSGGCIRVLPTGHVDCGGAIGNDYSGSCLFSDNVLKNIHTTPTDLSSWRRDRLEVWWKIMMITHHIWFYLSLVLHSNLSWDCCFLKMFHWIVPLDFKIQLLSGICSTTTQKTRHQFLSVDTKDLLW